MAGPLGCRSVFSPPSCPQAGSDVARGAAPLLAGDSAAALRTERTLFCLRKTSTHQAGSIRVRIIFINPTDVLRNCGPTGVKTARKCGFQALKQTPFNRLFLTQAI